MIHIMLIIYYAELYVGPEGYSMTQVNIGECEHDDQGIYVVAYCG